MHRIAAELLTGTSAFVFIQKRIENLKFYIDFLYNAV